MRQWLYRILKDHPTFLSKAVVGIVSPAIEGYTPGGIHYGSLSGRIYQQIPTLIRRTYAIPYGVGCLRFLTTIVATGPLPAAPWRGKCPFSVR